MSEADDATRPSTPIRAFENADEAGRFVADLLMADARAAVEARGRFTVAIPGGSSPRTTFQVLSQPAQRGQFPWAQTHLLWVDERAVPVEHPDSNFGAFSRDFLPVLPLAPPHVHRMLGELGPHEGASAYRDTLSDVIASEGGEPGALDAVLLGMGEDGHVASLFPGSAALTSRDTVIGIVDSPKPPPERITLTLPVLRAARRLVILALGSSKADAAARALRGEALPAQLASQGKDAIWVLDAAAIARFRRSDTD
ncbi:MAG: 6-phosphogluconolactonase [Phycisphaerales bacterium]